MASDQSLEFFEDYEYASLLSGVKRDQRSQNEPLPPNPQRLTTNVDRDNDVIMSDMPTPGNVGPPKRKSSGAVSPTKKPNTTPSVLPMGEKALSVTDGLKLPLRASTLPELSSTGADRRTQPFRSTAASSRSIRDKNPAPAPLRKAASDDEASASISAFMRPVTFSSLQLRKAGAVGERLTADGYDSIHTLSDHGVQSLQAWWDYLQNLKPEEFRRWLGGGGTTTQCLGCKVISRSPSQWPEDAYVCGTCSKAKSKRPCFRLRYFTDVDLSKQQVVEVLPQKDGGFEYWDLNHPS